MLGAQTPGLQILDMWRGLAVHALADGRAWASRGGRIYTRALAGGRWHLYDRLPEPAWRRLLGRSATVGQALRLGVHGLLPLGDGALLVVDAGRLWRVADGQWHEALRYDFRKPARLGVLLDRAGHVYCAEYTLNPRRDRPIRLWRSDDGGRTFRQIYAFAAGSVRHLHFIQQDPIDGALWLGTGDRDAESALWRSTDRGETWARVGGGSQLWRAIGLAFAADAVIWGTDAGIDAGTYGNRLVRWDRATQTVSEGQQLQGPVHGITSLPDGTVLLGTGCEGGVNETDARVHVWATRDGQTAHELASFAAGLQPKRAQYPLAHFVHGQSGQTRVWLILRGTLAGSLLSLDVRLG